MYKQVVAFGRIVAVLGVANHRRTVAIFAQYKIASHFIGKKCGMIIRTMPIQVFHSTTRDSHIELFETSVDVSCRENELLRMFPARNPTGQHGCGRQ